MGTTYIGTRTEQGCKVVKKVDGQAARQLRKRLDLWNHSPDGFEWGYGGSGPAQLALAILADATGNDRLAVSLHQDFKWKFVGRFPREGFTMTAEEVLRWAEEAGKNLDLNDSHDALAQP
jgi:hypothetical protein